MLIVNFKRYLDLDEAVDLCRICQKISTQLSAQIIAVVEAAHLKSCLATGVDCWTQRFEPDVMGYHGSLLNHSDYQLGWQKLHQQVAELMTHGKKICICAATVAEAVEMSSLSPDYVAYEPPSLIGSREKSVSSEKASQIAEVVQKLAPLPVLIGAGIHSPQDIKTGQQLGAQGFLVATDVVKASDPESELRELVKALGKQDTIKP